MTEQSAALVTCLDGRAWPPAVDWLRRRYELDRVDVITELAPELALAAGDARADALRRQLSLALGGGRVRVVALAGHVGCDGNPAPAETQREQIRRAVALLAAWDLPIEVIGLLADERGRVVPLD